MNKKFKTLLIIFIIFSLGLYSFSLKKSNTVEALGVESDNELLIYFKENFPNNEVLKCGYEDLNDDGRKDLLVIYNESKRKNAMLVVIDKEDGFQVSDHIPAPIENLKIEFKDIDKTGPIEIIISGSKDENFGYSIFRLIDDRELKDLFGEGMEDCC